MCIYLLSFSVIPCHFLSSGDIPCDISITDMQKHPSSASGKFQKIAENSDVLVRVFDFGPLRKI